MFLPTQARNVYKEVCDRKVVRLEHPSFEVSGASGA